MSPPPSTGGTQQSLLTHPQQKTPSLLLSAGTGTDETQPSSPCYVSQQTPALQDELRAHEPPSASSKQQDHPQEKESNNNCTMLPLDNMHGAKFK